ncbi:sugar-binding transcriptional regulator [Paenibacillus sp. J5C_2022]|uniref:sugar-binding transcriptional regulator n=1 Tax=Paenibacillus sp. J5C2022 TaxID=2977129 RepID=UPI0021D0E29F|nr:sugar-binding transcriptional regulator [Paenibacillus sp. J5C2022]MCU6709577.1 sugar-binding transcriptional regulator [Paenibacillus sp. J5C2022]
MEISQERTRLLVKISTLYYIDGMNQQEISQRLGISRPQISRMLAAAKSEGIVQIAIRNPFSEEQTYERAISETFGIKDVIVVHTPDADQSIADLQLARAASALLESAIRDRDVVGIMAGRTIASVGAEMNPGVKKNVQFVPMVGGWGSEGAAWHANSNTRIFAEKLKARYLLLNAPAVVASQEARNHFVQEQEIANVLETARGADVALVGIGQVSDKAAIVQSGYYGRKEIDEVQSLGAVSNICSSFLNEAGERIPYEAESRMIGLDVEDLRSIPNVVAIASGKDKVEAIACALRGRWMNVLITDKATAKSVLDWHRTHPSS